MFFAMSLSAFYHTQNADRLRLSSLQRGFLPFAHSDAVLGSSPYTLFNQIKTVDPDALTDSIALRTIPLVLTSDQIYSN